MECEREADQVFVGYKHVRMHTRLACGYKSGCVCVSTEEGVLRDRSGRMCIGECDVCDVCAAGLLVSD